MDAYAPRCVYVSRTLSLNLEFDADVFKGDLGVGLGVLLGIPTA